MLMMIHCKESECSRGFEKRLMPRPKPKENAIPMRLNKKPAVRPVGPYSETRFSGPDLESNSDSNFGKMVEPVRTGNGEGASHSTGKS